MTTRNVTARAVLGLAAVTALVTACGGSSGGVTVQPPAGGGTSSAAAATGLTITADDGSGTTSTWRLTCDPPGGDHPDPAGACAALARSGATALPPTPADRACSMIYGGPQRATVTGTWRGTKVDATLTRANGCEIARWKALVPLLPDPRA